ncbi:hypothetical protein DV736_g4002, partial [Chaetothyriales sp. CBS 134916]
MADISHILAALAQSQHQGSAPVQPPPAPGSAYPPPQYATPPGSATPYGLPQPISSGSVDLASIKPLTSGTLSLGDKRGFEPDRGPSRSNDPRAAGRGYRRSRSPSRSPPRLRDDYRDGHNPYRDERRGGNERGYNRDRSFSPPRGNRYSPASFRDGRSPPRERGGTSASGGDGDSEILPLEKSLVGLIIGRAGENLRRVENTTGARVQFMDGPETTNAQRHCKISGSRSARAAAKAEIFRIIEDGEAAKRGQGAAQSTAQSAPRLSASKQPVTVATKIEDNSLQILVPDRTVGLIIGRGGETIRDLQDRSGCHVNIVGESKSINGMRPVNLIGSLSSQRHAQDLINEIVESDQKGISIKELRNRSREDPHEKINDRIMVPGDAVGMIIGKGGETIKEMQNHTGCKINVSPASGRDIQREIGLIGSRAAIESAKKAIMTKVDAVDARNRAQGRDTHDDYSSSYPSQQSSYTPGTLPAAQPGAPPPAGAVDPYAAYGGYQHYVTLWYTALAAQQQGGQLPQDSPTSHTAMITTPLSQCGRPGANDSCISATLMTATIAL